MNCKEQVVPLRIWFKQKIFVTKFTEFCVSRFISFRTARNFRLSQKTKKSCLCFLRLWHWSNQKSLSAFFSRNHYVSITLRCLTMGLQTSRFSKNRKFVPLIYFKCELIFHIIHVSNSWVCQKTLPAIFEKKRLLLSLLWLSKWSLFVENGHPVLRPGAPGVEKSWRLRVKRFDHASYV